MPTISGILNSFYFNVCPPFPPGLHWAARLALNMYYARTIDFYRRFACQSEIFSGFTQASKARIDAASKLMQMSAEMSRDCIWTDCAEVLLYWPAAAAAGSVGPRAAAGRLPAPAVVLDVGVAGQAGVLLPPARVQQHAVGVILVNRPHLLAASLGRTLQYTLCYQKANKISNWSFVSGDWFPGDSLSHPAFSGNSLALPSSCSKY